MFGWFPGFVVGLERSWGFRLSCVLLCWNVLSDCGCGLGMGLVVGSAVVGLVLMVVLVWVYGVACGLRGLGV